MQESRLFPLTAMSSTVKPPPLSTSTSTARAVDLESQTGEEPPALPSLEPLLEHLLGLLARRNLLRGVLEHVGGHRRLEVNVEGVTGGHEVVVVDGLDERLWWFGRKEGKEREKKGCRQSRPRRKKKKKQKKFQPVSPLIRLEHLFSLKPLDPVD